MRPYTDEFPQELQNEFESKINDIITSGRMLPIADITTLLFIEWRPDAPIRMENFMGLLGRYMYTFQDPYAIKSGVTAEGILFFCIRHILPHLIRREEASEAA